MSTFLVVEKIRFEHCDPAAMVFYPRYFEMINRIIEIFFEQVFASPLRKLNLDRGIGIPTAAIETEFLAPSRLGDNVEFNLELGRIGNRSLEIKIEGACGDEVRLRSKQTIVFITLDPHQAKSREIPEEIRKAAEKFKEGSAEIHYRYPPQEG